MANELGPFHEAVKLIVFNPASPAQVRKVTATAAWVNLSAATFADCAVTPAQVGSTGVYFADLPTGLDAQQDHALLVYDVTATAFSDDASEAAYSPPLETAGDLPSASDVTIIKRLLQYIGVRR